MKQILQYIWIKEYKSIHNKEFHFTNEYIYSYDSENKILTRKKNDQYINDIYGDNINISAIVGENGSGKTAIMSAIMEFFTFLSKNIEMIIAFSSGEVWQNCEKVYYYYFENSDTLELCEKNIIGEYSFPIKRPPITCIYYSQALDWSQFNNQNYAIINLSSGYLLSQKNTRDYFVREFNEQFRFINQSNEETRRVINFKLPESVRVTIIRYTLKEVASKVGISKNMCRKYFSIFYDYDIEKISNFSDYFKFDVSNSILCAIVKCFEPGYASGIDVRILAECLKNVNEGDLDPKDYWRNILYLIKTIEEKLKDDEYSKEREKIINIENLFLFIEENMINNINSKYKFERFSAPFSFTVPFDKDKIDKNCPFVINFKDFWEKYEKVSVYFDVFDCSWNLSSGEISRLELYSRISNVKVFQNLGKFEYRDNIYRKEDSILLLIDEADMLLHPEWQRSFVNDIVDVFPKIFPNQYINVMLATHSPIMLSDIPKQNVLYLCKDDNNYKEQPETFGANIFNLYNNAFFLEKGAIGAFARKKFEDLLTEIIDKSGDKNDIQKKINIIGDDFIRIKFQEEFDSIYNNALDLEIKALEEKLKQKKALRDLKTENKN